MSSASVKFKRYLLFSFLLAYYDEDSVFLSNWNYITTDITVPLIIYVIFSMTFI